MNTDDLIVQLARDAGPIAPLRPPAVRLMAWLALAFACGLAGVWVYGLRPDHVTMTASRRFAVDATLAAVVLISGAAAALRLAVPGLERRPWLRALTVAGVASWAAILAVAVVEQGQGFAGVSHWTACAARVLSIALLPAAGLLVLLSRGAPVQPLWAAGLAGLSAAACGALAVQLTCPLADPAHVLIGHVLPVALTGLIAAEWGGRILD